MLRCGCSSPQNVVRSGCLRRFPRHKAVVGRTVFLGKQTKGSLSRSSGSSSIHGADLRQDLQSGSSRASLENDAPFALAIGACFLSTLVIPDDDKDDKKKEADLFGPDDVRSGAMQVISFIPLFNWLVWIFAWLDTGKQRYLAYAIAYLAPYLKTGLSLNPEDSWLPLLSVVACIVHVQLDLSVNAEGAEPPLIDVTKLMLEKSQLKNLRVRTDGLVTRLKELAEKTDVRRVDQSIDGDGQINPEEWKAIQKQKERDELREFDERLARSPASRVENVEETVEEAER
ncbi:hypothetical protein R1sor_014267 [Riccia sorocarpa]|uniref:Uncharacterized protein n=1 Tax=Riccia sorocarpa TaxID=122646 RepID=A0ABD3H953_9MARC